MKPRLLMDALTLTAIASVGGLLAGIGGSVFDGVSANSQSRKLEEEKIKKEGEEQQLFAQEDQKRKDRKTLEKEALKRDQQRRTVKAGQARAGGIDSTIRTSPLGNPQSPVGGERKSLLGL